MRYPDAEFACRIDFKSKITDTEPINLCSNFVPLHNRTSKLEFRGEIDLDLDSFIANFGKNPLKIYTFCQKHSHNVHQGDSDVFLYGQSEIDMSILLSNHNNFEVTENNARVKTIAGWYHIYDPEDPYRTMGQMKVSFFFDYQVDVCLKLEMQFFILPRTNQPKTRNSPYHKQNSPIPTNQYPVIKNRVFMLENN